MSVAAYIAVGSNIRPEENIPAALDRLRRAVRVTASSTFYRTAALDRPGDPDFLNGVWRIETELPACALKFDVLRRIEDALGRTRGADRYAPRTIDLDLLLHGEAVIAEPGLRIPDPDIRARVFLAVPLLELAPALVLPDTGESLASLPVARAGSGLTPDVSLTELLRKRITA
jgi:2-amino-4-hydroxy-6-hydroxymethyldihydropteridine diphosphokinase